MTNTTKNGTTVPADPSLPPLRMTHLLLFVLLCSLFLAAAMSERVAGRPSDQREAADARYRQIIAAPVAIVNAANATVLVLLVAWTIQRRGAWSEPGHWLAAWWLWQIISPPIEVELYGALKWLFAVDSDELIPFWNWAKSVHVLRSLPFGLLFISFAFGWRRVANTWPWKIYFLSSAIWLLLMHTVHWLPFGWGHVVHAAMPRVIYHHFVPGCFKFAPLLLLLAMLNDLLPGRSRRHWSHWVAACNPLLMFALGYFPPLVWYLRHG